MEKTQVKTPQAAGLRVQKRLRTLLGDPVQWLERGIPLRRIMLALLMLHLLLIEDLLGSPLNPWFSVAVIAYLVFLLCMEWVSRRSKGYHEEIWRAIRMPVHLIFASLILGLSGSSSAAYLVFLPWVIVAAIYLRPGLALGTAGASVVLTVAALWLGGQVNPARLAVEIALVAIGLLGAALFSLYLWQQLRAEWESRLRQLNALREVGSAITASAGMDETFLRVFELTGTLVDFETALILGWDPIANSLHILSQVGYDAEYLHAQSFSFSLRDGLTGYVASSKEPLLVSDITRDAPVEPKYLEIGPGRPLRSFLATPLVIADELVGVYELTSDKVGTFSERDREMLESLAPQIAIAVRNVELQERLQHQVEDTERQLKEMQDLVDTSVTMALNGRDVEALLRTIVSRAAQLVGAHGGGILLSYAAEKKVRMAFTHNLDAMREFECSFGEGVAGRVAESGQPLIVNDFQSSPYCLPALAAPPYSELLRALIGVPLQWEGQVIGVLSVSDNKPARTFARDDLRSLERFANQASLAIGNARLNAYREKLIRVSPDAIVRLDEAGRILEFNEAAEQILGLRSGEAANIHVADLYFGGIAEARKVGRMLVEGGDTGVRDYPTHARGATGERVPIQISGMALHDETQRQIGSFGIISVKGRELEYLRYKVRSLFLDELERHPSDGPIQSISDLRALLTSQLHLVREFCRSQYAILFANTREGETVLPAIAWTNLPLEVAQDLPHLNWRKAMTPTRDQPDTDRPDSKAEERLAWRTTELRGKRMISAIRGQNARFFEKAGWVVPFHPAGYYRSVLVLGPGGDREDAMIDADFLSSVNLIVATGALSWLQALYLREQQREAALAAALIIHRSKVSLLELNGKLGTIKRKAERDSAIFLAASEGEQIVGELSRSVSKTLTSNVLEVEPDDYRFQREPLAALVHNCADGFAKIAESEGRKLRIDSSVELLPYADIDPTFFSIALRNLLDNALKYSFKGTQIRVLSEHFTKTARIAIEDVGSQLPETARANLSEPGLRWKVSNRSIPGSGLGLWEANRIAMNHEGKLDFWSVREPRYGENAFRVRVWIDVPLRRRAENVQAQSEGGES